MPGDRGNGAEEPTPSGYPDTSRGFGTNKMSHFKGKIKLPKNPLGSLKCMGLYGMSKFIYLVVSLFQKLGFVISIDLIL